MYSVRSNVSLKICLFCLGLGIKPGMSIMSIAFKGNLRLIVYSIVRQRKTNLLLLYFDFSALTVCSDGSAMDRYFLFSLSVFEGLQRTASNPLITLVGGYLLATTGGKLT